MMAVQLEADVDAHLAAQGGQNSPLTNVINITSIFVSANNR